MTSLDSVAALVAGTDLLTRGIVVATVVANRSPYPIDVPARMAVFADSSSRGSLHPAVDATVIARSGVCLAERRSQLRSYDTRADPLVEVGAVGGDLDVFFEVLAPAPTLVIVGAGHIAVPLAKVARLAEFRVLVLDDRAEFATRDRFPDVTDLLIGPYRPTLARIPMDANTFVVLVTRGHVHDQACLEQVLESPAAYIGMIGSRRRVRTVMKHAAASGYDAERLRRVFAPIGLDIGAQTPAEIAIAIMAEIISVRQGGKAASLALGERLDI